MPLKNNEVRLGVLVGQKNYRELRNVLSEMNDADVARFIEDLPEESRMVVFRTLSKEQEMDVFAYLAPDTQQQIVKAASDREIADMMDELAVDDAVDMLEEMPAALVRQMLRNTSPETRAQINEFLRYPEHSAGSIMTAEFTELRGDMTVEDAIKRLRRIGENRETIYTCYVIDDTRHLQGVVTVKDLLLAFDTDTVEELMEPDVIYATTTEDREEVVRQMAKYDFISMPVVDAEKRLVGIVTVDDAVDVMQEEATEDFERMAAMAPSERPYLKTGVLMLARNRFLWLLVLMVSGIITGGILGRFELAFAAIPALITYMPMLMDTGGNAGSQSSTLVIRGMALGEIEMRDAAAVLLKELRVSLLVAVPLAAVNYLRIFITSREDAAVGLVVSTAMIFTVVMANTVGGMLPIIAKKLKIDPALMAAPLISTLVDAGSLLIYFALAVWLLHL